MNDKEQWNKYLEWSYDHFFSGIEFDQSVLEFGASVGYHSRLIQRQNPSLHIAVEPNAKAGAELTNIGGVIRYPMTYQEFYGLEEQERQPYDVVICCGILYHMLAPLDLLEKITNNTEPKKIIISNIDVAEDGLEKYTYENENLGRYLQGNNPIKYWHKLTKETIKEILLSVGYECKQELLTTEEWPKHVYYWQEYERIRSI